MCFECRRELREFRAAPWAKSTSFAYIDDAKRQRLSHGGSPQRIASAMVSQQPQTTSTETSSRNALDNDKIDALAAAVARSVIDNVLKQLELDDVQR